MPAVKETPSAMDEVEVGGKTMMNSNGSRDFGHRQQHSSTASTSGTFKGKNNNHGFHSKHTQKLKDGGVAMVTDAEEESGLFRLIVGSSTSFSPAENGTTATTAAAAKEAASATLTPSSPTSSSSQSNWNPVKEDGKEVFLNSHHDLLVRPFSTTPPPMLPSEVDPDNTHHHLQYKVDDEEEEEANHFQKLRKLGNPTINNPNNNHKYNNNNNNNIRKEKRFNADGEEVLDEDEEEEQAFQNPKQHLENPSYGTTTTNMDLDMHASSANTTAITMVMEAEEEDGGDSSSSLSSIFSLIEDSSSSALSSPLLSTTTILPLDEGNGRPLRSANNPSSRPPATAGKKKKAKGIVQRVSKAKIPGRGRGRPPLASTIERREAEAKAAALKEATALGLPLPDEKDIQEKETMEDSTASTASSIIGAEDVIMSQSGETIVETSLKESKPSAPKSTIVSIAPVRAVASTKKVARSRKIEFDDDTEEEEEDQMEENEADEDEDSFYEEERDEHEMELDMENTPEMDVVLEDSEEVDNYSVAVAKEEDAIQSLPVLSSAQAPSQTGLQDVISSTASQRPPRRAASMSVRTSRNGEGDSSEVARKRRVNEDEEELEEEEEEDVDQEVDDGRKKRRVVGGTEAYNAAHPTLLANGTGAPVETMTIIKRGRGRPPKNPKKLAQYHQKSIITVPVTAATKYRVKPVAPIVPIIPKRQPPTTRGHSSSTSSPLYTVPKTLRVCSNCHVTNTTCWRSGPRDTHPVLCNSCGGRWKRGTLKLPEYAGEGDYEEDDEEEDEDEEFARHSPSRIRKSGNPLTEAQLNVSAGNRGGHLKIQTQGAVSVEVNTLSPPGTDTDPLVCMDDDGVEVYFDGHRQSQKHYMQDFNVATVPDCYTSDFAAPLPKRFACPSTLTSQTEMNSKIVRGVTPSYQDEEATTYYQSTASSSPTYIYPSPSSLTDPEDRVEFLISRMADMDPCQIAQVLCVLDSDTRREFDAALTTLNSRCSEATVVGGYANFDISAVNDDTWFQLCSILSAHHF